MIEAPVLHVNGDDPESVVLATQMALDYRQAFKRDVVIDIICFRKLGHNEQDTPAMTQPLMYKKIDKHPGTRKLFAERLESQGIINGEYATKLSQQELSSSSSICQKQLRASASSAVFFSSS